MYKDIFNLRTHNNPQTGPSPGQHERKWLVHWFWSSEVTGYFKWPIESPPQVSDLLLYETLDILQSTFEERPWEWWTGSLLTEMQKAAEQRGEKKLELRARDRILLGHGALTSSSCRMRPSSAPSQHEISPFLWFFQTSPVAKQQEEGVTGGAPAAFRVWPCLGAEAIGRWETGTCGFFPAQTNDLHGAGFNPSNTAKLTPSCPSPTSGWTQSCRSRQFGGIYPIPFLLWCSPSLSSGLI